ncbi:hypothetical protein [Actinacidiphila sp. bgisy160]|uniref:hypothetical protein n=1 Tax=Actinacidiphila sp. bgisy160 TaxID=3413796 RepID=UPI003D70A3CD
MSGERARGEARLLLLAPLMEGDEEHTDPALRTLLDRLEPGWDAADRAPGGAALR